MRRLVAGSVGEPLDALCDRLLAEMLGKGAEDDVALLAVRSHPVGWQRPPPTGPVLEQPVAGCPA